MKILSMEEQGHRERVHGAFQDWTGGELAVETSEAEKLFLKDLYNYMKKRNSPIERIPNLGFKQIDLFLMFNTVRDLGGYQQVTAQQLWKQVYNTLGGNPRSTSAATCTRRHYERLLLPYEYHLKGLSLSSLPHHQHKHCLPPDYGGYGDEGPVPTKRRIISVPLHQHNPHPFHTPNRDQYSSAFNMPLHYSPYFHSPSLLPHPPEAWRPEPTFDPYSPTPPAQKPLDHLRYLAECYKNSSGLTEPLNLSVRGPRWESESKPTSSFSTPLPSKNPKFLNKPSPLYTHQCSQVATSGAPEALDGGTSSGASALSLLAKSQDSYTDPPSSSAWGRMDKGAEPSSPKTDFIPEVTENQTGNPDVIELAPRSAPPRKSREGEMEIEVPLSVVYNWLKLCRPSAAEREQRLEEAARQRWRSEDEDGPTNLTVRLNLQNGARLSEDARQMQRKSPANHPDSTHSIASPPPHAPPGRLHQYVAGQGVCEQRVSLSSQCPDTPDPHSREGLGRDRKSGPSSVLLLDSSSTPVLQLSSEEVVKLKRIISSSL